MPEIPNGNAQETAPKLSRTRGLRPFRPGFDSRRNYRGRPKSFDQLRDLAIKLAHEKKGDESALERLLRSWRDSSEPILQKAFVEYGFGKVPDKLETTGLENKTTVTLYFDHERGLLEGNNGR